MRASEFIAEGLYGEDSDIDYAVDQIIKHFKYLEKIELHGMDAVEAEAEEKFPVIAYRVKERLEQLTKPD